VRRACAACLHRSRLLASIGARLEIRSRLRGRLLELLAMDDEELLASVGCERAERQAPEPEPRSPPDGSEPICRHDPLYPRSLRDEGAPRLLYVRGGAARLCELSSRPVVAICGSTRSSDYGIEVARAIARGLAAAGVTIVSGLADALAASAQREGLAAGAGTLAVLAGGHQAGCPSIRRTLAAQIAARGCVLAEVPADCDGRVWGRLAAARILARIAALTLVVEADDSTVDLAAANVARTLGRVLAVVPGRVTSPASRGAHSLLIEGARLVRGSADVLELLGEAPSRRTGAAAPERLDPALRRTLERVGAGSDTPEKLEREGMEPAQTLLLLSRLEVLGLLSRGDGGRYVACAM
jgi:DNA processing protein